MRIRSAFIVGLLGLLFLSGSASGGLPTDKPWKATFYDWMDDVTLADVTLTHPDLQWRHLDDGVYPDTTWLSNTYRSLRYAASQYTQPTFVVRGQAKWFVLDDGAGHGVEGSGEVKKLRWGNSAAMWYQQDLPLAGGSDGNPYYHNPAVAKRAMMATMSDMMMYDSAMASNSGLRRSNFLGGSLNGWAYTYQRCKDVLDAPTKAAFEDAFHQHLQHLLDTGPDLGFGNMTTRAVAAAGRVYDSTTRADSKDLAVRVARDFLFGSETGDVDNITGGAIFRAPGYVGENRGPETTYNGVSYYHLIEARAETLQYDEWDFMDPVLRRMSDFKAYNYFPDPDGRWDGPAGYAARTGNSYVYDQRGRAWRDVAAAGMYEEALPFTRNYKNGAVSQIESEGTLQWRVTDTVASLNRKDFNSEQTWTPGAWEVDHDEVWPSDNPFVAQDGWHGELYQKVTVEQDPNTMAPFGRDGFYFNKQFGDPGEEEFWAYKGTDGDRDFGWFVEHVPRSWGWGSWAGGSLQTFWTKETGMVVSTMHDKGTPGWNDLDIWATDHLWGAVPGYSFTTAQAHKTVAPTLNSDIDAETPYVEMTSKYVTENGEFVLPGEPTSRFEPLSNGLRVEKHLNGNDLMVITELWATIPVFLRNAHPYQGQDIPDTTIEYFADDAWLPLGTGLTDTRGIRLGRDFGDGPAYAYILFDQLENLRLSDEVWQADYQSDNRFRNILINLVGNGVLSADRVLAYNLVTEWPITLVLGDMNVNDTVTVDDLQPFLLALADADAYEAVYGGSPHYAGDINGDGKFTVDDLQPFLALLASGSAIPEPATLTLLVAGGALALRRRRSGLRRRSA